jgi:hypothetical protein
MSFCMLMVSYTITFVSKRDTNSRIVLVTRQLAHDLNMIGQEIEKLYGVLSDEDLKLQ